MQVDWQCNVTLFRLLHATELPSILQSTHPKSSPGYKEVAQHTLASEFGQWVNHPRGRKLRFDASVLPLSLSRYRRGRRRAVRVGVRPTY